MEQRRTRRAPSSRAHAVTSARAARTTPRPACPKAAAPWPASAATSWRSGCRPPTPDLHPHGRRRRAWIGQAPFTDEQHIFRTWATAPIPFRPPGDPRGGRGRRQHHLQDPLQRRGRDDRRPAGRRPLDRAADRAPGRRRRRAKKIVVVTDEPDKYPIDAGFAAGRRHPPPRRARRRAARAARDRRRHGPDLRPDLRRREAPPPQARHVSRSGKRVFINDAVCEGCGDCADNRTACRSSRSRPSSAASARIDQSSCNKDYSCVNGFCPSFVTVEAARCASRAALAANDGMFAELPEPTRAAARASPTASWSPASAAPASSPSARCSAWPRISRARAAPCST